MSVDYEYNTRFPSFPGFHFNAMLFRVLLFSNLQFFVKNAEILLVFADNLPNFLLDFAKIWPKLIIENLPKFAQNGARYQNYAKLGRIFNYSNLCCVWIEPAKTFALMAGLASSSARPSQRPLSAMMTKDTSE